MRTPQRVVTGHNPQGQAVVAMEGPAPLRLPPPAGGTRIRIVDIPPDTPEFLAHGANRSGRLCRVAFVLLGGRYDAALAVMLGAPP